MDGGHVWSMNHLLIIITWQRSRWNWFRIYQICHSTSPAGCPPPPPLIHAVSFPHPPGVAAAAAAAATTTATASAAAATPLKIDVLHCSFVFPRPINVRPDHRVVHRRDPPPLPPLPDLHLPPPPQIPDLPPPPTLQLSVDRPIPPGDLHLPMGTEWTPPPLLLPAALPLPLPPLSPISPPIHPLQTPRPLLSRTLPTLFLNNPPLPNQRLRQSENATWLGRRRLPPPCLHANFPPPYLHRFLQTLQRQTPRRLHPKLPHNQARFRQCHCPMLLPSLKLHGLRRLRPRLHPLLPLLLLESGLHGHQQIPQGSCL